MNVCPLCNSKRLMFHESVLCRLCEIKYCEDCSRRLGSGPRTNLNKRIQRMILDNWQDLYAKHKECREHVNLVQEND